MGSSPGGRGADERAAVAALVVDEEAAPPLLPREISFGNSREDGGGDDDETAPSELSTLVPLSAFTPCYGLPGYDPELHRSPNRDVRPSLVHLHPTAASDTHLQLDVIEGSRKALRLVLWLGLLLVGALLGADVEYIDIMVRKAQASSGKAEVSQNSIVSSAAATVEAFDVDSPSKYAGSGGESIDGAGAEPERAARSRVDHGGGQAKSSKRGKAKKTKKDVGGRVRASKRGKANKTKTGKDADDGDHHEYDEDKGALATDIAKQGESEAKGEDDELIVTATATRRRRLRRKGAGRNDSRARGAGLVARIASSYRKQALLDF